MPPHPANAYTLTTSAWLSGSRHDTVSLTRVGASLDAMYVEACIRVGHSPFVDTARISSLLLSNFLVGPVLSPLDYSWT